MGLKRGRIARRLPPEVITALRRRCQTACVILCLGLGATVRAEAPAWQNELNAARLLALAAREEQQPGVARAFRELAAKYPREAAAQKACGDYFWVSGDPDDALPYWLAAQALAPHDGEMADSLGSAYLRQGRVKEAAAQYQRATQESPANSSYHFALANVLSMFRRQFDEETTLIRALEEYRRAAELGPGNRRLAQAYAETFYLLARPDWTTALRAWTAVRDLSGEATDFANVHLARICLNLGRADDARGYLDRLKDPAFSPVRDKLRARAESLAARQRNSSESPSR